MKSSNSGWPKLPLAEVRHGSRHATIRRREALEYRSNGGPSRVMQSVIDIPIEACKEMTSRMPQLWTLVLLAIVLGPKTLEARPFVYVGLAFPFRVAVIEAASNTVVSNIPVANLSAAAITPNGAFLYVTSYNGSVSVIATGSNTVVATVPLVGRGNALAITPDGAFVYVVVNFPNQVSVIATASNTVVATV